MDNTIDLVYLTSGFLLMRKDSPYNVFNLTMNPNTWKPRGCPTRYATPYILPVFEGDRKAEVEETTFVDVSTSTEHQNRWCAACMQPSVEPFLFRCGHNFCKRCIAETRYTLLEEFPNSLKDIRTRIRCPLSKCKATMPAYPLINGDFRFHEHRPLPEMPTDKKSKCPHPFLVLGDAADEAVPRNRSALFSRISN